MAKPWHGIRQSTFSAQPDPDGPEVMVNLPVSWGQAAADALAGILPEDEKIDLAAAATAWITPIAARAATIGLDGNMAEQLHALLAARRGAPGLAIWRGELALQLSFIFNPNAFLDAGHGFDIAAFGDAVTLAVTALTLAAPSAHRLDIGFTDLHVFLARLSLDYDSPEAADLAITLAAYLTAKADLASAALLARGAAPGYPIAQAAPLPKTCVLPALTEAANQARKLAAAAGNRRHQALTGFAPEPEVEALLGAAAIAYLPAISPLTADGALHPWASARLAALDISPEAALAAMLAGENLLIPPRVGAGRAMHQALTPHLHAMPSCPEIPAAAPVKTMREKLPTRRSGYTQKASVGGHKLFLSTSEFANGRLGEIFIAPQKENPTTRALMEAVATAVSLGLQHGAPLEEFVDAFTCTRFGPSGAVDGDPAVLQATSMLDYVFRNLAANYLANPDLAPAAPDAEQAGASDSSPLLPLDLPEPKSVRERRRLKLVSG